MKGAGAIFSSNSDEWATPPELVARISAMLDATFTLDVAATAENAVCADFYTKESDALAMAWKTSGDVWCNPPYSRVGEFMNKARSESYWNPRSTIVCLVPARTDTAWFHDHVLDEAAVLFVRGRVNFVGGKHSAPFPSMVVVYNGSDRILHGAGLTWKQPKVRAK